MRSARVQCQATHRSPLGRKRLWNSSTSAVVGEPTAARGAMVSGSSEVDAESHDDPLGQVPNATATRLPSAAT